MHYEYNDKVSLNKFDSIGNAHEEALKAMGIVTEQKELKRDTPKIPESLIYIYEEYRKLKFSIVKKDGSIVLYPRQQLTYAELDSYSRVTQSKLKTWELNLIMDIDAIFEGRE